MTGFVDLPNELIIEVWRHVVDPKSVENFALTNKTIYVLGTKFIKEHMSSKPSLHLLSFTIKIE